MKTASDLELQLRSMFVDTAPGREPERLFEAVMTATSGVRQRPGLLVGGSRMAGSTGLVAGSPARRLVPLLLLVGLLVLALVAGALLAGGASRRGDAVLPLPSASPAAASPSAPTIAILPGEPWIIYERFVQLGGGLFLMRPDGSGDHQVPTTVIGVLKEPDWSPDGTQIVFSDDTTETIWITGLDGSNPRALPCNVGGCSKPAWSPDGKRIAYSRAEAGTNGPAAVSVEVLDLASGKVSMVTRLERPLLADVPRWSPDGTQLVIGVDQMDAAGNETGSAIAIVPATGGDPRYLTAFDQFGYQPSWSPTGDEIVFSTQTKEFRRPQQTGDDTWDLYAVKPDGTGLRQVTRSAAGVRLWFPSWTPDGARILAADQRSRTLLFIDPATGALEAAGGTDAATARLRPTP
jgi:Tol biopolymer transport system component